MCRHTATGSVRASATWGVALALALACAANAQLIKDFEAPTYTGSPAGDLLTFGFGGGGQDGWYNPVNGSTDYTCFTYAGNAMGLPTNANGAKQFVAAASLGGSAFGRAQHDLTDGSGRWTIAYDICTDYTGQPPASQFLGSGSLQPSATTASYIQVHAWTDPATATTWDVRYIAYDMNGTAHAQPGMLPGPKWELLSLKRWYRVCTTVDFDTNRVIEVGICDIPTSVAQVFNPPDWYLQGGSGGGFPIPGGFRFFSGGSTAGNISAWDNLSIAATPADVVGAITGAEVTFGNNVGAQDPAKLGADDDDRTEAKSKVFLSAQEPNLAVLKVTAHFDEDVAGACQIVDTTVQDQASQPNVTCRVRALPAGGGAPSQVAQYAVTFNVDSDHRFGIGNSFKFIDGGTGDIMIELRYSTIALLSPLGFTARTDLVTMVAK